MSTFECPLVKFELSKHPDADSLSIATIKGWQCVVRTEDFVAETFGVYIPIDAVPPKFDHAEIHPLFGFLEGKKIKTIKLRQVLSQGFLVPFSKVAAFLDERGKAYPMEVGADYAELLNIKKWEPPVNKNLGTGYQRPNTPGNQQYTNLEHYKSFNELIVVGELVQITEKLHGTSARYSLIDGQFVVGTRRTELATEPFEDRRGELVEIKPTAWHQIAERYGMKQKLEQLSALFDGANVGIYGEIVGHGVQDLTYGHKEKAFYLYDILLDGNYVSPFDRAHLATELGLTSVPTLYVGPFTLDLMGHRLGKDTISNSHVREGFVIEPLVPRFDPRVGRTKLKVISEDYDQRKNATDFQG